MITAALIFYLVGSFIYGMWATSVHSHDTVLRMNRIVTRASIFSLGSTLCATAIAMALWVIIGKA